MSPFLCCSNELRLHISILGLSLAKKNSVISAEKFLGFFTRQLSFYLKRAEFLQFIIKSSQIRSDRTYIIRLETTGAISLF